MFAGVEIEKSTALIGFLVRVWLLVGAIALLAGGMLLLMMPTEERQARTLPRDRGAAVTYVALGDSTVAGMGASNLEQNYVSRVHARLRARYPSARLENLGVSGATSADVTRDQLPSAVALQPHLVTLSVGPNDIVQGRDVTQYERHLEAILSTLSRETHAVVVVNLLPDMAVAPRFRDEEKAVVGPQTVLFNQAIERKARQYGAEVVDLYTPSQKEVPRHPELLAWDRYHPSDAGYARWAELMWRGVEARLKA